MVKISRYRNKHGDGPFVNTGTVLLFRKIQRDGNKRTVPFGVVPFGVGTLVHPSLLVHSPADTVIREGKGGLIYG